MDDIKTTDLMDGETRADLRIVSVPCMAVCIIGSGLLKVSETGDAICAIAWQPVKASSKAPGMVTRPRFELVPNSDHIASLP